MSEHTRGITKIAVSGFKSLRDRSEIEIRPLTILAGANSSGKSSIMQPLLLMKQTLEAQRDTNNLILDGKNIVFTQLHQFFSIFSGSLSNSFQISIEINRVETITNTYGTEDATNCTVIKTTYSNQTTQFSVVLEAETTHEEILRQFPPEADKLRSALQDISNTETLWSVGRGRCFLYPSLVYANDDSAMEGELNWRFFPTHDFRNVLLEFIHVPGLRGNPRRSYYTGRLKNRFVGTFEDYVGAVILTWSLENDPRKNQLVEDLQYIGMAHSLDPASINDVEIEIRVGRSKNSKLNDMVSIADVGFGVSQVLPVLVALLVAEPGQLVYIEQPELHLHPRAQHALAKVLVDAAKRGVRVVAETHSDLLLLGVQTEVANGNLPSEDAILHLFRRDETGATQIESRTFDQQGTYGEWDEEFGNFGIVRLQAQKQYLSAVANQNGAHDDE
jgi:predicted ATPase